jgi:hypothetical protein
MRILRPSEITTFPQQRDLSPEQLAEVYALARAAFSAEDLHRYTELDEGVPMDQILAELEEMHKHSHQEKA